jgi:hypothetical protein
MLYHKQSICNGETGDCLRTAVECILELPLATLRNYTEPEYRALWFSYLCNDLWRLGKIRTYTFEGGALWWPEGYWVATVPSLNVPKSHHAVVMYGDQLAWDVSPNKRYEMVPMWLVCDGIVLHGYEAYLDSRYQEAA